MHQAQLNRREFVTRVGGFLTPFHLVKSLKLASCGPHAVQPDPSIATIERFSVDDRLLTCFGKRHRVFSRGEGRGVLVLHELPGLTPFDIDFAFRLSEQRFHVFLPLLFGEPGEDKFGKRLLSECVFGPWPWEELAPVNPWVPPLVNLADTISTLTGGPIGVVGMCLTGILPISLMASTRVVAPVVSQPTMPLPIDETRAVSLGLPPGDIAQALRRLDNERLEVLAFRASTDCYCPAARLDSLSIAFPGRVVRHDVDFGSAHGHSILAAEFHRPGAPPGVAQAFEQTVSFLRRHLD